ncbi:ParB family chromosome partitioning protein [Catenibacillus scindens]|uniref:ParB family chromosome partitioning protein n=1 Tax=Catenibacillus scindens TaxID=673271 RepID=A0A7W8HBU9_9FIRM|nr:ParB/RepB/Spo0J family partition protein [Catenibacillus scindens]MBB5265517.1 ParB family chromosome partitioning protein [Catenibacillus scindens]
MASKMSERLNFKSVEELLGVVNEEAAMDIEICKISGFKGHPFKVIDDDKMQELVESIKVNGVLSPVLIRPTGMDTYEMISGHRRLHAAELAGLTAIPSIIREMTDDEAVIAMVDANIQREELLPSERAYAYKMKLSAMKRQGERNDLSGENTSAQNERKLEAADILGEEVGVSRAQIRRYIRLTELIPELMEYVDKKRIPFTSGVEISYLDQEIQKWLFEYIRDNGLVKPKQIALLREACKTGIMTEGKLIAILNDSQPGRTPNTKNLISEKKLRKYFPSDYTEEDMRSVIVQLLEQWSQGKEAE